MPGQDRGYRPTNAVQYLANFPGARIERDMVAVVVEGVDDPIPVEVVNADELGGDNTGFVDDSSGDDGDGISLAGDESEETDETDPYRHKWADSITAASMRETDVPGLGDVHNVSLTAIATEPVSDLVGVVEASQEYAVHVFQGSMDRPILSEQIAEGVPGGELTQISVPARSLVCAVVIVDESGSPDQQEVTGNIHVS